MKNLYVFKKETEEVSNLLNTKFAGKLTKITYTSDETYAMGVPSWGSLLTVITESRTEYWETFDQTDTFYEHMPISYSDESYYDGVQKKWIEVKTPSSHNVLEESSTNHSYFFTCFESEDDILFLIEEGNFKFEDNSFGYQLLEQSGYDNYLPMIEAA